MMRFTAILFPFLLLLLCMPAGAQQPATSKQPLEITADSTLEWNRAEKLYIARGNAIAKQGASELHGETLTARYAESAGEKKGTSITRIDAVGNVKILSDGSTATGGRGYYDVSRGFSELTGGNLTLKTKTDTVTARDKLTYDAKRSEMTAYGQARAVRGEDTITADRLIGRFIKDIATGDSTLSELEAVGNVVVTTPTEVMRGNNGIYDARTNTATITGNVRIDRGASTISGARGEMDLNTNISRMYGGADTPATTASDGTPAPADGRVRGVFYPE